jgi:uncharacterized membrane protein YeiH
MVYADILTLLEVLGVFAFSLTGIYEARRLKMDLVGVYTLAMITAFGGGTFRDLFLQRRPLFWIESWPYCVAIFVLSLFSVLILKGIRGRKKKGIPLVVNVFDAIGLGLFSVLGAVQSLQSYPGNYVIAVLMGVVTGTFGGVIRDIVGNKIPTVFQKSQLYATCALAGCVLFILLDWLLVGKEISIPVSAAATLGLRMLAVRFDIRLPL